MLSTQRIVLAALVAGLVGCDHATKHAAQQSLRDETPVTLLSGALDLTYTENRGVGFNLLRVIPDETRRPLVLGLRMVATSVLLIVWFFRRREGWPEQAAMALLLAGALGNGIDGLVRGYVIDFIHLHHWPVFNMADICLTIGGILLFLVVWKSKREAPTEAALPGG